MIEIFHDNLIENSSLRKHYSIVFSYKVQSAWSINSSIGNRSENTKIGKLTRFVVGLKPGKSQWYAVTAGFRIVYSCTLYASFTLYQITPDSIGIPTLETLYGLYCWNREEVISVKYLPTPRLPFDVHKIGKADRDSNVIHNFSPTI